MKVSADYRMLALDALRGKWKTAVLTGIAASTLGATIVPPCIFEAIYSWLADPALSHLPP